MIDLPRFRRGAPRRASALLAGAAILLPAAAGATAWKNYGGDPRHTAKAPHAAQALGRILWSSPVDLQPQYTGDDLLIHYGSPLVTSGNTVVFPVKTGAYDGFRVEARRADSGSLLWSLDTDYTLPVHGWVPSCGCCLAANDRVVVPAAGGTVLVREDPDLAEGTVTRRAFYGDAHHEEDPGAFDAAVRINTPVTSNARGDVFFGFVAEDGAPLGLKSGFARIPRKGRATWITAADAANDGSIRKVVDNCAPALSRDGRVVYFAVNDIAGSGQGRGYLVGLDSRTLFPKFRVRLEDALDSGSDAYLSDDGTSSPTVGPDGDVYFGVLSFANHFRGWLLHFSRSLRARKIPGGFGWDDTASIVPRAAVPSYTGKSRYLVLTKSNDYVDAGGDGVNRLAVLDPRKSMTDPISGATVMQEVLTVAGPTPDAEYVNDGFPDAVREWCINTAAVDVEGRCALVNNEDGILYRWDFATNTLTESIVLTEGIGEAYTPTVVGPDGIVYAINNATLFAVGE